ncbi:MAG: PAS domain S-box protein, partial [Anaerolineales bacterium]
MRTLWERLTTPSDSIQNPEQRQHAYLLASLLVLLVPLFIIPEAIRTLATGQAISFFWLSTTLFIISYGLSRTRHYRVGIAVVLATLGVMPIVSILSRNHAPEELLTTLIWMIPNVVVGSLLLSVRGTAVYVLLNIASVFLLLLVVPGATLAHLAFPLGFITAVFIPLLAVTAVRQQYLNQIKNQSTELAHSEEQFRALVEHSHAAILLIGDDYRFIYVNERACDIFGYSRDELIDLDFRVLLDDESREHVADRYRRR